MTNIKLHINEKLALELRNVREIHGHDDSLPYDALLLIHEGTDVTFIGTVFNSGWGGPTDITPQTEVARAKMQEVDDFLKKNYKVQYRDYPAFECDLEYAVDCMAETAVENAKVKKPLMLYISQIL